MAEWKSWSISRNLRPWPVLATTGEVFYILYICSALPIKTEILPIIVYVRAWMMSPFRHAFNRVPKHYDRCFPSNLNLDTIWYRWQMCFFLVQRLHVIQDIHQITAKFDWNKILCLKLEFCICHLAEDFQSQNWVWIL